MSAQTDFHAELITLLPQLGRFARAMTRNVDAAADLVQETVVHALKYRTHFRPGTNLKAWTHRIMRNLFIDSIRIQRPTEELDTDGPDCAAAPSQLDAIAHKEFLKAFDRLSLPHREALVLSVIDGQSYGQIAAMSGCAVGTVKSRVCRARDRLSEMMLGEETRSGLTRPFDAKAMGAELVR